MYSRSAKGGEKADPNRNPWLAKMRILVSKLIIEIIATYQIIIRENILYFRNVIPIESLGHTSGFMWDFVTSDILVLF